MGISGSQLLCISSHIRILSKYWTIIIWTPLLEYLAGSSMRTRWLLSSPSFSCYALLSDLLSGSSAQNAVSSLLSYSTLTPYSTASSSSCSCHYSLCSFPTTLSISIRSSTHLHHLSCLEIMASSIQSISPIHHSLLSPIFTTLISIIIIHSL